MRLRRSTELLRTTVTQEFRQILAEDTSATPGAVRRVQILVPQGPEVFVIITPDERFAGALDIARAAGANRSYKGTVMPPNAQIQFHITPEQTIWACAGEQFAHIGVLVEHMELP